MSKQALAGGALGAETPDITCSGCGDGDGDGKTGYEARRLVFVGLAHLFFSQGHAGRFLRKQAADQINKIRNGKRRCAQPNERAFDATAAAFSDLQPTPASYWMILLLAKPHNWLACKSSHRSRLPINNGIYLFSRGGGGGKLVWASRRPRSFPPLRLMPATTGGPIWARMIY